MCGDEEEAGHSLVIGWYIGDDGGSAIGCRWGDEEAGYGLVIGRYVDDDGGLAIGGVSAMAKGGDDLSHLMGQLGRVEYHRKRTDPLQTRPWMPKWVGS